MKGGKGRREENEGIEITMVKEKDYVKYAMGLKQRESEQCSTCEEEREMLSSSFSGRIQK